MTEKQIKTILYAIGDKISSLREAADQAEEQNEHQRAVKLEVRINDLYSAKTALFEVTPTDK